jgi:hypothetical protein
MGWLLEIREALEKRVFDRASEVLGLEVDLLFFDTTSTYFVTGEADAPVARDEKGSPVPDGAAGGREAEFRTWGKSWASPRTTATTCPRSSSAWPSPATGSRCACGAGPGTRTTPR